MPEREPLEHQAIAIVDTAKFLLQKPEMTTDERNFVVPYGPQHSLELHTALHTKNGEPYINTQRLSLYEMDEQAQPVEGILGFNLNEINLREENLDESRMWLLPQKPYGASSDVIHLVQSAIELGRGNADKMEEVTEMYENLLTKGASMSRKFRSIKIDNNSRLGINSTQLQGPPEHHLSHWLDAPEMGVSLRDEEKTILFEKIRNGGYETYTQQNGYRNYVRPENRDADGRGIVHHEDILAVEEASRAMGLRNLRREYCDPIQKALTETKRQQ